MNLSNGRIWPYAIGASIIIVFGFCVTTVLVTSKADIQMHDAYMTSYQDADANANELIESRINFDKKYILKYKTEKLSEDGCDIKYSLTTLDGQPIKDAKMILAISRPEIDIYNKKIENPSFEENMYVFKGVKFPKTGAWNLLLKAEVGDDSRFYDIKTDTRINKDRSIKEATTY